MKTILSIIVVVAVLGTGIWYAFGNSGGEKKNTFGSGNGDALVAIGKIQQNPEQYLGKVVTVEGKITRECPGSGCWWYVKDDTGEIRSDSLGGGFALPLHQEGKTIRTTGKVVKKDDGQLEIAASGAELK